MISLVSHRSEIAKIWSENERETSEKIKAKRKRTEKWLNLEKIWSENGWEISKMKRKNRSETKKNWRINRGIFWNRRRTENRFGTDGEQKTGLEQTENRKQVWNRREQWIQVNPGGYGCELSVVLIFKGLRSILVNFKGRFFFWCIVFYTASSAALRHLQSLPLTTRLGLIHRTKELLTNKMMEGVFILVSVPMYLCIWIWNCINVSMYYCIVYSYINLMACLFSLNRQL
jgi:hypothetical protein